MKEKIENIPEVIEGIVLLLIADFQDETVCSARAFTRRALESTFEIRYTPKRIEHIILKMIRQNKIRKSQCKGKTYLALPRKRKCRILA